MTRYAWKPMAFVNGDAQAVGERLAWLQRNNGERLTPRVVLDDARPVESPLHQCFEWDNTRAAELYREDQARAVLRSIRVIKQDGETQRAERMFVNVVEVIDEEEQHGYVPLARVLSDAELFKQMCQQAARDLSAFEDRYSQFTQLATIGRGAREQVEQLKLHASA